jgi:hypothetical protein
VPYKDVFVETHKRKSTGEFVSKKARATMVCIYCINKYHNRQVIMNIVILNS